MLTEKPMLTPSIHWPPYLSAYPRHDTFSISIVKPKLASHWNGCLKSQPIISINTGGLTAHSTRLKPLPAELTIPDRQILPSCILLPRHNQIPIILKDLGEEELRKKRRNANPQAMWPLTQNRASEELAPRPCHPLRSLRSSRKPSTVEQTLHFLVCRRMLSGRFLRMAPQGRVTGWV
jgi:hypothetical protein